MSLTDLIGNSLDEVLTRGFFTKEINITKKVSVTITTISGDDLSKARMSIPDRARKELLTYSNAEKFEILSRAIIKINKVDVLAEAKKEMKPKEGTDEFVEPEFFAISSVRKFLGSLPPKVLDNLSDEYNKLAKDQSDYIQKEMGEDVENF